jgi:TorA maturation chaperone TorD
MNDLSSQEIETTLTDRINLYNLLARLYRLEVDPELLEEMQTLKLGSPEGDNLLLQGYRLMLSYLLQTSETSLVELAADYTRIFIAPDRNGAYPYESVYTSKERLLMQDARDQVLDIYRRAGLQRSDEFNEPEDHLAFELEYMAFEAENQLAANQNSVWQAASEAVVRQEDFLKSHLLNWVPAFASDVTRLAKTSFYSGLAQMTIGFLELDQKNLEEYIS